jgi:hypothetical protein
MKIDKVTITGADNDISYLDLLDLQDDFPFVEWGILFSESKEGSSRYPSSDHRAKHFIGGLNLSAHFCGWWARQILEEQNYKLIYNLPPQYSRIQLNYDFHISTNFNLDNLNEIVRDTPNRRIILQYNRSNSLVLDKWMSKNCASSKIHFLHDSSGGRGTVISGVPPVIGGHYTGYAGGINIENVDQICCDIGRENNSSYVWVDLESGARTNDKFDTAKVRYILDKLKYHVKTYGTKEN